MIRSPFDMTSGLPADEQQAKHEDIEPVFDPILFNPKRVYKAR
jgi:hypothetical protein